MMIYPAIDLLDGEVVRLHQGRFDAVTRYGDDPETMARSFLEQGAEWIHVVDLSGARDGVSGQAEQIGRICQTGLKVQSGGGIRGAGDLVRLFECGITRVVIGSLAVTAPDQVLAWLDEYGVDRLTLAFDVRQRDGVYRPAISGWKTDSLQTLDDLLGRYASAGLRYALVTDIDRDGALSGPNVPLFKELQAAYPDIDFQASGGVASLADIDALADAGLSGVIIGKALYENRFTLGEAIQCLQSA